MKTNNIVIPQKNAKDEDIAKKLYMYLRNWRWFILSIVVCLALAFFYLKMATPTYDVHAKILLENETNDNMNSLQNLGVFNVKSNTDNELEILKTSHLIELAVKRLGIYTQYLRAGKFRNTELYGNNCPVSIRMPEAVLDTLRGEYDFDVKVQPNGTYTFIGRYGDKPFKIRATEKDSQLVLPFGMVYFSPGNYKPTTGMTVGVTIKNPAKIAEAYLEAIQMELTSKTTTTVSFKLNTTNQRKGIDLMNAYLEAYNEEDLKARSLLSQKTSDYLGTLLNSLGDELSSVEKKVEKFKVREGITDINSETQLFINRTGQYGQRRLDVGTQLGIVKDLETYVNKNENRYQLLPSGLGIQNGNLNTLISEYNNLLLERKRLSRTATDNNQVMIDLTDRIEALFKSVQSSINNEKRNLIISQQDLMQKDVENTTRIKSIPRQEREISDLSRERDIKSQLYLFLLQKRDENFLSSGAMAPKFKVIITPGSNGIPVSPKSSIVLLASFVLGLFLPVFFISIHGLFHFTIENKDELKRISIVPILGEIPKRAPIGNVMIHQNSTNGFTEMFRLLRTNLMYVLDEPDKKVINIVSSIKGEGKTSVTINLALSLALLERKVLIICLDIRRPMINKILNLDNETGVTQYLSGQMSQTKLVRSSGLDPNLWVITSGPIPPNPNELLAKAALDDLIDQYRTQFDYIIIDTPPISVVSDTLLLNRFADVNLYIVRADFTPKNDILEANEIFLGQKLNNMYFVLNAIDMQKSSNYRNGYSKKRGYGYGYYSNNDRFYKRTSKNI